MAISTILYYLNLNKIFYLYNYKVKLNIKNKNNLF